MKTILISATAIFLTTTAPVHAQLLGGGGGLGGMIGGTLGGQGTISGPVNAPTQTVQSATRGAIDARARAEGSKSVDTRQGSVATNGNSNAGVIGTVSQATQAPIGSVAGSGSASGSASSSGGASAQLIGTNQLRSTVGSAVSTAGTLTSQAQGTATSAAGSAQGTASGTADLAAGQLAAAGSAAAQVDGALAVASGVPVTSPDGATIGTVSQLVTDARGNVEQVLIDVDGMGALLPAGNFSASGNALVSAMNEAEVRDVAESQTEEAVE